MVVSGQQHHAHSALTPVKEHPVTIRLEGGWTPESMWTLFRREKYCTVWESNPGIKVPVLFLKGIQEVSFEVRIRGKQSQRDLNQRETQSKMFKTSKLILIALNTLLGRAV
jgi:hypothetical protein